MINSQKYLKPKLPWGIKIEMLTPRDPLLQQIQAVAEAQGVPVREMDPTQWFSALVAQHMNSEVMIVVVRTGGILTGFLVLELANSSASYAWVQERYRGMGLGERFYSSACTNLGTPRPQFTLHKDLKVEFAPVLKTLIEAPAFDDPFYVLNPRPVQSREAA